MVLGARLGLTTERGMLLSNMGRVVINASITQQGPVAHFVLDAMSIWVSDPEFISIGNGEDGLDF